MKWKTLKDIEGPFGAIECIGEDLKETIEGLGAIEYFADQNNDPLGEGICNVYDGMSKMFRSLLIACAAGEAARLHAYYLEADIEYLERKNQDMSATNVELKEKIAKLEGIGKVAKGNKGKKEESK